MTDNEKLKEIKKLADAMYYAAQYLTTDASRLHKAMDEYHKFIIHEWREEPKPKFKVGDCIRPIDSCLGSQRTICEVCDSWYVTNQGTLDFEFEDNWELVEEPVSMWHDASEKPKPNMELICVGQYGNPLVLSSNSDSLKSRDISKWAYFNDLLNLSNVQRTIKNWKEPVSEDYRKRYKNITRSDAFKSAYENKSLGEVMSVEGENPVSEDLEEASKKYALNNTPWDDCVNEMQESFKAGAQWRKKRMIKSVLASQEMTCIQVAHRLIGSSWNLACPTDKIGLKSNDKVKVIIIKEE